MKITEFRQLIRKEVRKTLREGNDTLHNEGSSTITKNILGIDFKIVPTEEGNIKFEFVNAKKFLNSNVSVNALVNEILSMLDKKYGKGLFIYRVRGGNVADPKINGLEFKINPNQIQKLL